MNLIKIGQLIAESLDKIINITKMFADGKLTKEEINELCKDLLNVINTILKLNNKPQLPDMLAVKVAEMINDGVDVFAILKAYKSLEEGK